MLEKSSSPIYISLQPITIPNLTGPHLLEKKRPTPREIAKKKGWKKEKKRLEAATATEDGFLPREKNDAFVQEVAQEIKKLIEQLK